MIHEEVLRRQAESHQGAELKSLPIPELQERLGAAPDGLSQAEAQQRLVGRLVAIEEDQDTIDLAVLGGLKDDEALEGRLRHRRIGRNRRGARRPSC